MSFIDDDNPKKKAAHEIGSDLSMLSVGDLDARIALLGEEILRLQAEREKKLEGRSAADNLFRR